MRTFKRISIILLMAVALLGNTPQPSSAYILNLGLGNSAIAGYGGTFGTVDVSRVDNANAIVRFTSILNPSNGYHYAFGGEGVADFNLAANSHVTVTIGSVTGFHGNHPRHGDLEATGSKNVAGFGRFNRTFRNSGGFSHALHEISFNLHNSRNNWFDETSILTGNADGYRAAVHVFVATPDYRVAEATGYATEGGVSEVPEPTTLLTVGLVILGMAGVQFRRRK